MPESRDQAGPSIRIGRHEPGGVVPVDGPLRYAVARNLTRPTPTRAVAFPGGTTTVTCTATDPSGNTATASLRVIVVSGVLPPTGGRGGQALLSLGLVLTTTGHRRRA